MNKSSSPKISSAALIAVLIMGMVFSILPSVFWEIGSAQAKNGADDPAGDDRSGNSGGSGSNSGSGSGSRSGSSSKNSGSSSKKENNSSGSSSSNRGSSSQSGSSSSSNSGGSGSSGVSGQSDQNLIEDARKEIESALEDATKVEGRFNLAKSRSLAADQFGDMQREAKELLQQAQQKLASGDAIGANALAEQADDKLKRANDGLESILGQEDNPNRVGDDVGIRREDRRADRREERRSAFEFESEAIRHRSTVANVVSQLLAVARDEESKGDDDNRGIGRQVRVVAQAQEQSRERVGQSLDKLGQRGSVAKFLIGPNFGELNKVKKEIEDNKARIAELAEVENQIGDNRLQERVRSQREFMEQENERLEAEIEQEENRGSVFGWLLGMFN